ncbi:MAG: YggS family pyridoxal phosphate-dependent enzyme [Planctomycetia bacterium]|nr:YggS family pyridoxal phosphate-dependent enzyme [Planctomycetia bacterium]
MTTTPPIDPKIFEEIAQRVRIIREEIADAAIRAARQPQDVALVAVSKYATPNDGVVEGLLRAGLRDLAENRMQRLQEKIEYWSNQNPALCTNPPIQWFENSNTVAENDPVRWHFIGPLQRNKARRVLSHASLIHSVDSWKLLETLERILEEENDPNLRQDRQSRADEPIAHKFPEKTAVLLEVFISQDENKQGFEPQKVLETLERAAQLKRVVLCGLMGMAGLTATEDQTRKQFESLKILFEQCRERFPELTQFRELSIGMSHDFKLAIEQGATLVRIGSALYPQR